MLQHYAAGNKPSPSQRPFANLADYSLHGLHRGTLCPHKLHDELTQSSELLLYSFRSVPIAFGYSKDGVIGEWREDEAR